MGKSTLETENTIRKLLAVCAMLEVDVHEFNQNSFRISKGNFHDIDFYPKKKSSFLHRRKNTHYTHAWIRVHDVIDFIIDNFTERLDNPNQINDVDFDFWQPMKPRLIRFGLADKVTRNTS